MLVILKIPVVYLCGVVWWAIKAEPRPLEGAGRLASLRPRPLDPEPCDWPDHRRRPARPLPRGGRALGARHAAARRPVVAR